MEKTIDVLKIITATIFGAFITAVGGFDNLLQLYIILFVSDLVFGGLKAIKNKNFASAVMFWGFINKIIAFVVIAILSAVDGVLGINNTLRNITIIWFCICEGASILENLIILGLPMPDGLKDILSQVKKGFNINITKIVTQIIENYKIPMSNKETEETNENSN